MKFAPVFYFCTVACVFIIACNSNDDKKVTPPEQKPVAVVEDTTSIEVDDSTLDVETVDTFNTMAFSNYAKQQSSGFDWARFRLTGNWIDDSALKVSYEPDGKFYAEYGKLIKYSPDRSMFIDLDSYNIDIQKDSKGRLIGIESGPDCEVSLVNLKTKQKIRLLFGGPEVSIEDAMWLDNDNVVLMGVHDYGDSTGKVAAVWKINVPASTTLLYELRDASGVAAAQKIMGQWRRERLKSVSLNK